tara:strand:- start:277 stop:1320 length:1044 start_codon:yes stop_codon:yes gene_type:complete
MKLVVFRSEASPEIGAGHIMRCLSLADKLAEKDWICYFACSSSTVETVSDLANSKHRTLELTLQSQNQPQYLMSLFPQGIELLVVDHYELDSNYESSCRPWASAILAIDDLANRTHDADILLDQTINRPKTDYKNLTPNDCWILIGPEYALLREEFSKNRSSALCERDRRPPKLDRILVSLGSQDLSDTTSLVLNNIYSFLDDVHVDVILSGTAPHLARVKELMKQFPSTRLFSDVDNMSAVISKADLAIGAGGISSWERCCLGLPTVSITVSDNQALINKNLDDIGAVCHVGEYQKIDSEKLANSIETFHLNPNKLTDMSREARRVCDGLGANRLVDIITDYFARL